jgi:uncharacterized membrane protein
MSISWIAAGLCLSGLGMFGIGLWLTWPPLALMFGGAVTVMVGASLYGESRKVGKR